jgi:hypothetical protein
MVSHGVTQPNTMATVTNSNINYGTPNKLTSLLVHDLEQMKRH